MVERLRQQFDFELARDWYLKEGTNTLIKGKLEKRESRTLCERFLRNALQQAPAAPKKAKAGVRQKPDAPALIRNMEMTWKRRYKDLGRQFYTLGDASDEERRKVCLEIVSALQEEVVPQWKKIDTWRDTGTLPKPEVSYDRPVDRSRAEKMQRLLNLRVYISRGTNDEEKLEAWKQERDALEVELNRKVQR